MPAWERYIEKGSKLSASTGQKFSPTHMDFLCVQLIENWFVILMIFLTLVFFFAGVFNPGDVRNYSFWLVGTCLGVIVGWCAKANIK